MSRQNEFFILRNLFLQFSISCRTITEEPESPANNHKTTTNSISVTRSVVHSVRTTDSNNAASQNNKNQNSIQASLSSTNSNLTVPATATTTTKVQTKSNQSSQRTVLKSKRILSSTTEIKDNIVNKAHEHILSAKHSTPKQNASNSSRVSPNINLDEINLNDHLAYKEYKEAGEYWK